MAALVQEAVDTRRAGEDIERNGKPVVRGVRIQQVVREIVQQVAANEEGEEAVEGPAPRRSIATFEERERERE